MCMQYHVDKIDDPGRYKVTLLGPPGRGRFERSKHVDLGESGEVAKTNHMMTEGELVEHQLQYIGELHAQLVAQNETMAGVLKITINENKELTKVVTEASRKLAEIEQLKMRHELELKIHNDEIRLEQEKEEIKSERWKESMDVLKESGAVEGVMKAILRKINNKNKNEDEDDEGEDDDTSDKKAKAKSDKKPSGDDKKSKGKKKSKADKAKARTGKPKIKKKKKKVNDENPTNLKDETVEAIKNGKEMSDDQIEEVFKEVGLKKIDENPTAVMVEVLKMMIDDRDQWGIVEETLTEEQFILFKKITNSKKDKTIRKLLRELYAMKGARRFLKLEKHLDDDQQKYIEKLLEIAMS